MPGPEDDWIQKAEGDLTTAALALRRRKQPLPDIACFHCQQCAEKYLKAFLAAKGEIPERTHVLVHLLHECAMHDATVLLLEPVALELQPYAVRPRYPGMETTRDEARSAIKAAKKLRAAIRLRLGLPVNGKKSRRRKNS